MVGGYVGCGPGLPTCWKIHIYTMRGDVCVSFKYLCECTYILVVNQRTGKVGGIFLCEPHNGHICNLSILACYLDWFCT